MLLFALERGSLKNSPLCFSLEQILLCMSVLFSHSIAGIHARTEDMILNTCCHRSCPLFLSVCIDEVSPWLGFSTVGIMAWSALRKAGVLLSLLFVQEPSQNHPCNLEAWLQSWFANMYKTPLAHIVCRFRALLGSRLIFLFLIYLSWKVVCCGIGFLWVVWFLVLCFGFVFF